MNWLVFGTRVASFVLQYPFERHLKPSYEKSDKIRQELLSSVSAIRVTPSETPQPESKPAILERSPQGFVSFQNTIRREQEGDYCFSCVPSKHLQRSKDALLDALNIANTQGKFTDVAESKLQAAVYELNGAEKDLEMATVPEIIRPAVDEMHTQIRKLRNFLRQDQSGLEIATATPERFDDMKNSLETAYQVNDALIKYGYDISKLQLKARREEVLV